MARGPHEKKFEADMPKVLWDEFERWADDRLPMNNKQILAAMFRLFLAVPESLRLLAIAGRLDHLEKASRESWDALAAEILQRASVDAREHRETQGAGEVEQKSSRPSRGHTRRRTG